MQLSREQFSRVEALYFDAQNIPQEEWPRFLIERCADDEAVRDEVRSMLGVADGDVTRPLQRAMDKALWRTHGNSAPQLTDFQNQIGKRVGPYRLERLIGQGGMGTVFLAQQEEPVRRTVALKFIRPGMDSPDVVARFESERQALALMSHPNVARVLDAGTTEDGRHYFVMEYVADALAITTWCDGQRASVEKRIELFITVCDAVHHAHQRGVIHRDLKPTNILVASIDGKPTPKVIDFGVAKAVERQPSVAANRTYAGQLIGTPEYMSPEQANLGVRDVDTRSDIYALGVILYELLTGSTPLNRVQLQDADLDQILQTVREVDAARPSTRVSSDSNSDAGIEAAEHRSTSPTRLVRLLRGELDWIICKALEKDRRRRYGSAFELAEELRRCLAHEPVLAGPPSTLYRLRKFVRRHRAPVVTAALLALALLGGVITTAWQAVRASRAERSALGQRELAERRFDETRKLANALLFDLDDTLRTAGPTRTRQMMVTTALKYLDSLAAETALAGDLSLRRDIARGYVRIGNIQYIRQQAAGRASLGDLSGAISSYQKALELSRRLASEEDSSSARYDIGLCLIFLGDAHEDVEEPEAAEACFDEACRVFATLVVSEPENLRFLRQQATALDRRGGVLKSSGNAAQSKLAYEQALQIRESIVSTHPKDQLARMDLAMSQQILQEFADEQAALKEQLNHMQQMLPAVRQYLAAEPDNPRRQRDLVIGLHRVAEIYLFGKQLAEALAVLAEAVPVAETILRNDPQNAVAKDDLAHSMRLVGAANEQSERLKDAIKAYERSAGLRRELVPLEGPTVGPRRLAEVLKQLVGLYRRTGQFDQAVAAAREAADLAESRMNYRPNPATRRAFADALDLLADTCRAAGRLDEAAAATTRRSSDTVTTRPSESAPR